MVYNVADDGDEYTCDVDVCGLTSLDDGDYDDDHDDFWLMILNDVNAYDDEKLYFYR